MPKAQAFIEEYISLVLWSNIHAFNPSLVLWSRDAHDISALDA